MKPKPDRKIAETRTVKGFMCMVDWEFELGDAVGGNSVYGSVPDLKKHRKCWKECGIVEVEVRLRRVVRWGTI